MTLNKIAIATCFCTKFSDRHMLWSAGLDCWTAIAADDTMTRLLITAFSVFFSTRFILLIRVHKIKRVYCSSGHHTFCVRIMAWLREGRIYEGSAMAFEQSINNYMVHHYIVYRQYNLMHSVIYK